VPQYVLGIVYTHENAVLEESTAAYCRALNRAGFTTEVIDLSKPHGFRQLAGRLDSGEVAFCFGIQGVGSRLERHGGNLWTKMDIPFLGLHYDNPCYNPFNHHNLSPWIANLYYFESFLEIQRRYIGGQQITGLLPFEILETPPEPQLDFMKRPIKFLFPKMGGGVDEYVAYFNALPAPVRDGVWQQIERARHDPNLLICDLVDEVFRQLGYDRTVHEKDFWTVVQSVDYYMRRQRAIDLVNWLKFQEGAVIIGDGWDMIDRTGARAEFRPSMSALEVYWLYEQAQFVCNANPYGRDVIHERIVAGLLLGCCVLTDANAWWDRHFNQVPALTRFYWDRPLDDQLQPVTADLQAAAEAAKTGRLPAVEHFTGNKSVALMIEYAARVRAQAQTIPAK
jgi:hypothetical protein